MGAPTCSVAASWYREKINQRQAETGSMSPVEITGGFTTSYAHLQMSATFRLVDPAELTDLRATLLVYEDNVYWCCDCHGYYIWQHVTRLIYDQAVTLTQVEDQATVVTRVPLDPDWDPAELHVVAYLQTTGGNKEIIQGSILPRLHGFSFDVAECVRSVPEGNGLALFRTVLTNIGQTSDTFRIEPRVPFVSWPSELVVCHDAGAHHGAVEIPLAPQESCYVWIRVQTDRVKDLRAGVYRVTALGSLLTQETTLRVFNGCYSILLVDDDFTMANEKPLTDALDALGFPYEHWDITNEHNNESPRYRDMAGYDHLIWQTGYAVYYDIITRADRDALCRYMNAGGTLFLTSQEFLDNQWGATNSFIADYLGVASWTTGVAYDHLLGVADDPIGGGLDLPLTFPDPGYNRADAVVPGATAMAVFATPDSFIGTIRNTMPSGAKSVFMPFAFNGISETDPDPNNTRTVLQRILDWMRPDAPSAATDPREVPWAAQNGTVHPNPYRPGTKVTFVLSESEMRARR